MIEDLSTRHDFVGDLFERPQSPEEWDRYRLSDEQIESYRKNGYLTGVRMLADAQVEVLREELAGLMDPSSSGHDLFYEFHSNESADPSRILFHALGAWRISPGFHDILWNPAFTVPASQLLEGSVRFWHDQLFCKPAQDGGVVAWHQDYSYWTRTKPMAHLSCWIALDDCDKENGAIAYIPGSHRWDLLPMIGLAEDMEAIRTVLTAEQKEAFKPFQPKFKKGEVAFHNALVVHGSFENKSDRPRRAAVINVFRDGVISDSDNPLLEGVPPVPKGEKMDGRFFPILPSGDAP